MVLIVFDIACIKCYSLYAQFRYQSYSTQTEVTCKR